MKRPEYTPREAAAAANASGFILILGALSSLTILNYPVYAGLFDYLPYPIMLLRYSISCGIRIAGTAAGLGIFARREWARKLALGLETFTLVTLWWKHPAAVIARTAAPMADKLPPGFLEGFRWLLYAVDGLAAVAILYLLTRPKVKERFERC